MNETFNENRLNAEEKRRLKSFLNLKLKQKIMKEKDKEIRSFFIGSLIGGNTFRANKPFNILQKSQCVQIRRSHHESGLCF